MNTSRWTIPVLRKVVAAALRHIKTHGHTSEAELEQLLFKYSPVFRARVRRYHPVFRKHIEG